MILNPKSLGIAGGAVQGLFLFIISILAVVTGYGMSYLTLLATLVPMYTVSLLGSVIMLVFGFVMGYITFYLIASVYNHLEA